MYTGTWRLNSKHLLFYPFQDPSPLLVIELKFCFGGNILITWNDIIQLNSPTDIKVEPDWFKLTGESHLSSQVMG